MPCLNESTDQLDLNIFIHVLEKGKQGWFSVAHNIRHLFGVIKKQFLSLQEIFIKDNAGCLFVYLEFIVPIENFSLIWRRHYCQ